MALPLPDRSELRRRGPRLLAGLVTMGTGIAVMVLAGLGLGPWDVLHQGISNRTGVPIGTVGIIVGVAVLVLWVPLRQRLGVGTVLNTFLIGITIDVVVLVVPPFSPLWLQSVGMVGGVVLYAAGSGLYIGAGLGPGPRDGLMTGLASRGASIRLVRTGLELTVLAIGYVLGGTVGIGTVVLALSIGPLVQLFLGWWTIPPLVRSEARVAREAGQGGGVDDVALALVDEQGHEAADAVHHTPQVHGQHGVPPPR